jgi:hypothetical protein
MAGALAFAVTVPRRSANDVAAEAVPLPQAPQGELERTAA